jgi:hypothetical protein
LEQSLRANGQQEIAVDKRNHYWILDCILALTAIALGTAALCSFVGVAVPPSGWMSSIEALVCVAVLVVGGLFAGFLWGEQRQPGRRHAVRAHQERHALMMRRASHQSPAIGVAETVRAASSETKDTPETLLVKSLTDVKAERRGRRTEEAVATAA